LKSHADEINHQLLSVHQLQQKGYTSRELQGSRQQTQNASKRRHGLHNYKGNVQQGFEELTNGFICGKFYNRKGIGHQICANSPEVFAQVG
jgi:trimethylamine:corrinoid methyltransferase-like protein